MCGQYGDNCLCYINGIELTNDIEAAVEDAAFISCWMLPLTVADEVEVVSIADSTSVHSLVTIYAQLLVLQVLHPVSRLQALLRGPTCGND